jgi:ribosomal protein S8E
MRTAHRWKTAAAAAVGAAALVATTACSGANEAVRAQNLNAANVAPGFSRGQANTGPILVTCEPDQRTLVRQTVLNGEMVSQVECVRANPIANTGYVSYPSAYGPATAMPVSYPAAAYPAAYPVPQATPAVLTYPAAPAPVRTVRSVRPQRAVYQDERRVRSGRSWKKSAVIIGSSAGIGAGVGAAIKGKKGALIGAALGGGSAAIWDQVTRR